MNGGPSQSMRVLEGAFADKLPPVKRFRAWRQAGKGVAHEINLRGVVSLDDAQAIAGSGFFARGDMLFIHEYDAAKRAGAVHIYRIREGAAIWQRNPVSGLSERVKPTKPEWLSSIPVNAFEPTPPFNAFRDDPTGIDHTLIEGTEQ